jgi:hypothetical protein
LQGSQDIENVERAMNVSNPDNPWLSAFEVEEIFSGHIEKPEDE